MSKNLNPTTGDYEEMISHNGLRLTKQRRQVFDVILDKRDHPTATEVFIRVKDRLPNISLATVYNCLETLVECGMVKQVNVDRAPTRYCPNLEDHGHFVCDSCGHVTDIELLVTKPEPQKSLYDLPQGSVVTSQEVTVRGLCPNCSHKN
ncbi:MAG: Fur family transcriptional regulator [Chthoniobacterales bacterium]